MTSTDGTFTTTDGTELYTRTWNAENPRYNVLLVHGLGEHSGRWVDPMSHLVQRGATVFAYDLRGHGHSEGNRTDVDSFEKFYTDIAEMAEATVATSGLPWVLYGHSLGGLQAAGYLMADQVPRPNVAILSAPAMTAEVPAVLRLAAPVLGRITPGLRVPTPIAAEQLSRDPAVGEKYFADELVEVKATTRFGMLVLAEQDRLSISLDKIATPTFVIHGADDTIVTPSASAGLAQSQGVERRLYPKLRHEIHNEPEGAEVMGDVADWIESKLL